MMTLKKLGASGPGFTLSSDMLIVEVDQNLFSIFPILSLFNEHPDFHPGLLTYIDSWSLDGGTYVPPHFQPVNPPSLLVPQAQWGVGGETVTPVAVLSKDQVG